MERKEMKLKLVGVNEINDASLTTGMIWSCQYRGKDRMEKEKWLRSHKNFSH